MQCGFPLCWLCFKGKRNIYLKISFKSNAKSGLHDIWLFSSFLLCVCVLVTQSWGLCRIARSFWWMWPPPSTTCPSTRKKALYLHTVSSTSQSVRLTDLNADVKNKKTIRVCYCLSGLPIPLLTLSLYFSDAEVGAQLQYGRHAWGHPCVWKFVSVQGCTGLYYAKQRYMMDTNTNQYTQNPPTWDCTYFTQYSLALAGMLAKRCHVRNKSVEWKKGLCNDALIMSSKHTTLKKN